MNNKKKQKKKNKKQLNWAVHVSAPAQSLLPEREPQLRNHLVTEDHNQQSRSRQTTIAMAIALCVLRNYIACIARGPR